MTFRPFLSFLTFLCTCLRSGQRIACKTPAASGRERSRAVASGRERSRAVPRARDRSRPTRDRSRPTRDRSRPLATARDRLATARDRSRPLATARDRSRPLATARGAAGDLPEALKLPRTALVDPNSRKFDHRTEKCRPKQKNTIFDQTLTHNGSKQKI